MLNLLIKSPEFYNKIREFYSEGDIFLDCIRNLDPQKIVFDENGYCDFLVDYNGKKFCVSFDQHLTNVIAEEYLPDAEDLDSKKAYMFFEKMGAKLNCNIINNPFNTRDEFALSEWGLVEKIEDQSDKTIYRSELTYWSIPDPDSAHFISKLLPALFVSIANPLQPYFETLLIYNKDDKSARCSLMMTDRLSPVNNFIINLRINNEFTDLEFMLAKDNRLLGQGISANPPEKIEELLEIFKTDFLLKECPEIATLPINYNKLNIVVINESWDKYFIATSSPHFSPNPHPKLQEIEKMEQAGLLNSKPANRRP